MAGLQSLEDGIRGVLWVVVRRNQLKVKTHLTTVVQQTCSSSAAGGDYDLLRQLANYTVGSGKE